MDDLKYLKEHQIDRNQVSQELSKIFSQMVYINGCESPPRRAHEHSILNPLARQTSTQTRTTATSSSVRNPPRARAPSNSRLSSSTTGSTLTFPTTCASTMRASGYPSSPGIRPRSWRDDESMRGWWRISVMTW